MKKLDALVARHDLRALEEAVAKRRAQEEKRLERLVAEQKRLRAALEKVERELQRATERARKKGAAPARRPNARRLNDISLGDAMEKVLAGRKNPMHYKDLTASVVERGLYRTRSKNLLSTVAVTLKRDRRFKKVEPGYYSLR